MEIAYTDWRTKKIKNRNILFLIFLGLLATWIIPEISFGKRIGGFFVASFPLLLLAMIVPESIGGGDIKLMAAAGFLLGRSAIWNAFAIGMFIAGVFVICLLIIKKANRKTEIALGPFLCIGVIIAFWA